MIREPRAALLLALAFALVHRPSPLRAQSLTILDVPFIAQSELLCGGAAAAMVMRYWGERGVDADSFRSLVDGKAGGIRTDALAASVRGRQWNATAVEGSADALRRELQQGRPVIALIEDRAGTFHYVVVVARQADGVVFHDPARAPYRVASAADFDRRWSASGRWMLIVTPPDRRDPLSAATASREPVTVCDEQVAFAVQQAQQDRLDEAERTLVGALSCPGSAVFRELAGLRVLQRRWAEAADLASAALVRDPRDAYASKLLATARFVSDDPLGALEAWNQTNEPRIDLIRVDGLGRTRYRVVEHALGLRTGRVLTRDALVRARRRVSELPAAPGSVDFTPLPSGLAEVRATVVDKPLAPRGLFDLGVLGVATAFTREVVVPISSPTGGGEQITAGWRFWAHRPLYQLAIAAPAPWRGIWRLGARRERQPFTNAFATTVHDSLQLEAADWASGTLRWHIAGGLDRWNGERVRGMVALALRTASKGERFDASAQLRSWFGAGRAFQQGEVSMVARSSARLTGVVITAGGGLGVVDSFAPPNLWFAGDTGRARPLLLRAHPILADGERFRSERMARLFAHQSTEVQRWWRAGPFRAGVATFVDAGWTARRLSGRPITDVDVGFGLRGASPGRTGALRLDIARGLRDGNTAVSAVYTADIPQ